MHRAALVIEPQADRILLANPACCRLLDWPTETLLQARASRLWLHDLGALSMMSSDSQAMGRHLLGRIGDAQLFAFLDLHQFAAVKGQLQRAEGQAAQVTQLLVE